MERQPEIILLGANRAFVLQKSESVWIVSSGTVEVYYALTDDQGKIMSSRTYLYSAQKGEMLMSLKKEGEEQKLSLLVVSNDAQLLEIRKEHLFSLNQQQLVNKIEKWVTKVAGYLQKDKPHRLYEALDGQKMTILTKGQYAFPSKDICWGKLLEGNISFWGVDALVNNPDSKITREIIPISNSLWVKAQSNEVTLELFSTYDALQDEIGLMLSLSYFQQHAYSQLYDEYQELIRTNSANLNQRIATNDDLLSNSLLNLSSIIDSAGSVDFEEAAPKNKLLHICRYIGKEIGIRFQEPQHSKGEEPSIFNQLLAIGQASNVRIRKVILRGKWWEKENGHLLAFTQDGNQPVALIQSKPNRYEIKDGVQGPMVEVDQEIVAKLQPLAYMFLPAFDQKMSSVKKVVSFAMRGLQKDFLFVILAALGGSLMTLITPILSGIIFDDVIPQADRSFLVEVFFVMVAVAAVMASLQLIRGIIQLRVETKSNINLQAGLMDHLLRLPVPFFQQYSTGDLTMRTLGINSIRQILSSTLLTAALSGLFSIVSLILLFFYAPNLAWIGILMAVFAIVFELAIGLFKLKYDRKIAHSEGDIQGLLFELLSGISKVRITGSEKRMFSIWANKFGYLKSLNFHSESFENYSTIFRGTYPLLTRIFFFGAIFYFFQNPGSQASSMMQVGVFVAFISAFSQFLNDCLSLTNAVIGSLDVIPLFERIRPILEEEPETLFGSADPGELSGDIEMNGVSFRYQEDQPLILNNLSFKVKAGEMVAFVGPSGSGKSTIMRLLLGFEEAESGSVYYDGQAFDTLNRELVRKQMGVVLQHGALMSGSIYKNIVGNSELQLEQAMEAAEMAGLKEDIDQMPMGMHTVISEGASTFSGGQRQRLMIARAIVHKPRILYMDEATSALDNRTQKIVSESLEMLQATRIVIAHRLSTVMNADRIYVVDKGRIVESGSYHELIRKDGLFAKLAKRQIA